MSQTDLRYWHAMEQGQILAELGVSRSRGLSSDEAARRLSTYGPNALAQAPRPTLLQQFFEEFRDFLVILLLISAAVSALMGETADAAVIGAIIILNAVIGVAQKRRAENALEALKKMAAPTARVLRDGQPAVVESSHIVPGDILLLDAGDTIAADGRLLESALLKVDESSLTGESVAVDKNADVILGGEAPLGDRINCVYMGSTVTYGRGMAVVVGTGMHTEMGKIASLLDQTPDEQTPLQARLAALGRTLGIAALAMVAVVFAAGMLRGEAAFDMFLTSVSLAVAAIPEGLPTVVTIVLSIGVQRMAARNAIIRSLPAVETLGSADVICSDKTGTLTTNQMTVRALFTLDASVKVTGEGYSSRGELVPEEEGTKVPPGVERLLTCAVLCCDARVKPVSEGADRLDVIGDPTEGSIVVAGLKADIGKSKLEQWAPRVAEIPFESERKRMTTLHRLPESYLCCSKGAPDEILNVCTHVLAGGQVMPLTEELRARIEQTNARLAEGALRVLGVAQRELAELPAAVTVESVERGMVFLGLIGMQDPPRPEAAAAVAECRDAGITPVMITGDHRNTAVAIARDVGIMVEGAEAVLGSELAKMSDEELDRRVESIRVYARVAPEHKVRIVDTWRRKGRVVAMTGDGVNDAPALKAADIGAAMGRTGTDVAKSAAHMILADDNFATIVAAVREGRVVFDNIKKTVLFLTSCNLGEILVIFAAILLGLPRPLLAIQILWLNLITDGLPALALGVDPAAADIMKRTPRGRSEAMVSRAGMVRLLIYGLAIGGLGLWSFAMGLGWPGPLDFSEARLEHARTMCLLTMSFAQLFHALNSRSELESLVRVGPLSNATLIGAILVSGGLQAVITYVPYLSKLFHAVPITGREFGEAMTLAIAILAVGELTKLVSRTRRRAA
ncbi:MAG: Calcium-transporting ATPase 1 [Firmicutes bacterium ADurb.Bin506]|nr:MAG: Calcium-transporting ATPase 1 [Firmicutes bacterium ADurb.Bin506]